MLFGTVGRLDFSSCGALDLTRSVMFVLVFKQPGQPASALELGWTKHLPQTGYITRDPRIVQSFRSQTNV